MYAQNKLTEKSYWDFIYKNKKLPSNYKLVDYNHLFNYNFKKILKKLQHFYRGGEILEIGAGSSDWLIPLASVLDHSGCTGLEKRFSLHHGF